MLSSFIKHNLQKTYDESFGTIVFKNNFRWEIKNISFRYWWKDMCTFNIEGAQPTMPQKNLSDMSDIFWRGLAEHEITTAINETEKSRSPLPQTPLHLAATPHAHSDSNSLSAKSTNGLKAFVQSRYIQRVVHMCQMHGNRYKNYVCKPLYWLLLFACGNNGNQQETTGSHLQTCT